MRDFAEGLFFLIHVFQKMERARTKGVKTWDVNFPAFFWSAYICTFPPAMSCMPKRFAEDEPDVSIQKPVLKIWNIHVVNQ